MHLLRPTSSRTFTVPRRLGPSLAAMQALFPTTRELGAEFHFMFGTDNPGDLCQITGRRAHPNLRPYIIDGGANYTVPPTVTIANGAVARAVVTPSNITASLTSGGAGYTALPTITAVGGVLAPGGWLPRFKAIGIAGGALTSFATLDSGSGILVPPAVQITGGNGNGAAITLSLRKGVRRVDVTNGGAGYTAPPSVNLTGGTFGVNLQARAVAVIAGGVVTAVYLLDGGYGYINPPAVTFSGGGGAGAAATAVISANTVRTIELLDAGNQPAAPAVVLTGGDGAGAAAGCLMSGAAYVRTPGSIVIPAGSVTDNNAQNGLLLPMLDTGDQTICAVVKVAMAGTSQILMGSATNAGSTTGGFEIKNSIGAAGHTVLDYNVQIAATPLPLPAGAVDGTWMFLVHSISPVPGQFVHPSAANVQSSTLYARAGAAAPVSVAAGERVALSRARLVGLGNCWQLGVGFRGAVEYAEAFIYRGKLSEADINAARARSVQRTSARGIVQVGS